MVESDYAAKKRECKKGIEVVSMSPNNWAETFMNSSFFECYEFWGPLAEDVLGPKKSKDVIDQSSEADFLTGGDNRFLCTVHPKMQLKKYM